MKITGMSSYIILEHNGRKIKVMGEMIVGGFVADLSTIKGFEYPYEDEVLPDSIKSYFINEAIKKRVAHTW
ncbi:hypothetical protein [Erwinia mallotivora]|uniref:hypothetical protein n=1 Tax=Erwinia mallotivora TaxID=69222 RepID=UPI0004B39A17|nr:hypothetical protein [Erwinia mallotivora]